MLGAATGSIQVGDGRRIAAAPWSIIARDGPEVAGLGPATARIEDGTACLVGKQLGRGLQDLDEPRVQRLELVRREADPVGQCRAIDRDAFAGQDLRLAVERQVIGVFRHEHIGDQRLGRQAAFDRGGWAPAPARRHPVHRAAGVLRAPRHDHAQLGRHLVEALGDILADDVQGAAAAGAGLGLRLDDDLLARQMRRQVAAIGASPVNAVAALDVASPSRPSRPRRRTPVSTSSRARLSWSSLDALRLRPNCARRSTLMMWSRRSLRRIGEPGACSACARRAAEPSGSRRRPAVRRATASCRHESPICSASAPALAIADDVDHCVAVGRATRRACTRDQSSPSRSADELGRRQSHHAVLDGRPAELARPRAAWSAGTGPSDPRTAASRGRRAWRGTRR